MTKECPFCKEPIQPTASVCRYCGREVSTRAEYPQLTYAPKFMASWPMPVKVALAVLMFAALLALMGVFNG